MKTIPKRITQLVACTTLILSMLNVKDVYERMQERHQFQDRITEHFQQETEMNPVEVYKLREEIEDDTHLDDEFVQEYDLEKFRDDDRFNKKNVCEALCDYRLLEMEYKNEKCELRDIFDRNFQFNNKQYNRLLIHFPLTVAIKEPDRSMYENVLYDPENEKMYEINEVLYKNEEYKNLLQKKEQLEERIEEKEDKFYDQL